MRRVCSLLITSLSLLCGCYITTALVPHAALPLRQMNDIINITCCIRYAPYMYKDHTSHVKCAMYIATHCNTLQHTALTYEKIYTYIYVKCAMYVPSSSHHYHFCIIKQTLYIIREMCYVCCLLLTSPSLSCAMYVASSSHLNHFHVLAAPRNRQIV